MCYRNTIFIILSEIHCKSLIIMNGSHPNITDPMIIERSDFIKFKAFTSYDCTQNFTAKSYWRIFKIDELSLMETLVNQVENPSLVLPQLKLKSQTLEYGLYKFVYTVVIQMDIGHLVGYSNVSKTTFDHYVKIIPSGIAVFALENGNNYISIGKSQSFILNPFLYSYDIDFLVETNSLDFKFYCFVYDSGKSYPENHDYFDLRNTTDLHEFKLSKSSDNTSCFNTASKL